MSAEAAPAPAVTEAPAPVDPAASPAPEAPNVEAVEDPDAKLSPIARFAKGAKERKGAKLAAAGRPVETAKAAPEPAAKAGDKAPERGPDGKFLPADGKAKEPEAAKPAEDSPKVEAAVAKAEDAGIDVPEQKQNQTDAQYLNQITRLMRENKQAKAEALEHKAAREKAEASVARSTKAKERLTGKEIDEEAFIEQNGCTFEEFIRKIAKGPDAEGGARFKPKANLPPELAEMKAAVEAQLAEIKAHKDEIAAAKKAAEEAETKTKAEAERAATLKADHEECDGWLKQPDMLKKYPRLAALESGAEHLRDEIYARWPGFKGPQPDIAEVAQHLESTLKNRTSSIFSNEAVILEMLQDPKTREMVSRALSAQSNATDNQPPARDPGQTKTAKVEGPPTLSQKVSQEAPAPVVTTKTLSSDEREEQERAAYHARMRAWSAARNAAIDARTSRS